MQPSLLFSLVATCFEALQLIVKMNLHRVEGKVVKVSVLIILLAPMIFARSYAVEPALYQLNLPEQDAAISLNTLADKTDHSILYSSKDLKGIVLKSLRGSYTLSGALDLLLKDTPLYAVVTDKGVIVISSDDFDHKQIGRGEDKMKTKKSLLASAIAFLFSSGGAAAEDIDRSDRKSGSLLQEEIVVTAQKREQNLQDVPISITAFSGDALKGLGIQDSTDIVDQVSNFSLGTPLGEGNNPAFTLRGVGLNDFQDSNEGPVGLYIDGVYLGTQAGQVLQLFDIERVEVLKGPQGTLYGRNTTGGLIHFISKKPTEELEGYLDVTLGEFNTRNAEGVISGSLTDTVRARLSLSSNHADGHFRNNIGPHGNDTDNMSGRAQLQFLPTDELDILLNVHASKVRQNSAQYGHQGTFSADAAGTIPCTLEQGLSSGGGCYDFGGYRDEDGDLLRGSWNYSGILDIDVIGGNTTIEYEMANEMKFVSITGYEKVERIYQEDSDGSPLREEDLVGFAKFQDFRAGYAIEAEQFSQEFRLSKDTGDMNWVVGLYYFDDQKETVDGNSLDHQQFLEVPNGFFLQTVDYSQDTTSWSVFGQMDYSLTDRLVGTLGLRYTSEEKDFDYSTVIDGFPVLTNLKNSEDYTNVSWKAGLSYDVSDDAMLYLSISEGFKSGGFNGAFLFDPSQLEPFDEETLLSYEVGFKSTLLDGALRFNAAAFYYDYSDLQIVTFPQAGVAVIGNTDAEVYGAEAEITWNVTDGFETILGIGWLDTEVTDSDSAFDGNDLALAAELSVNGIFRYYHTVDNIGSFSYQLDFTHFGDQFFTVDGSPFHQLDGTYTLWNANITYVTPNEAFRVRVAAENVFDKEYVPYTTDFSGDFGTSLQHAGRPRVATITVSYTF